MLLAATIVNKMSSSAGRDDLDQSSKDLWYCGVRALKRLLEDLRLSGDIFTSTYVDNTLRRNVEADWTAVGVYACGHRSDEEGPDLYVSGIGKLSSPLTQNVSDQLQQLCHHTAL